MSSAAAAPPGNASGAEPSPMPAAKRPVSAAILSVLGVIWSVLLIAVAVVCLHDALVAFGVLNGRAWIANRRRGSRRHPGAGWLSVVGVLCVLVGLFLLFVALKPRRRKGIEVEAAAGPVEQPRGVRPLRHRRGGQQPALGAAHRPEDPRARPESRRGTMSGSTYLLNRVASFVVAAVLIAGGLFLVVWPLNVWSTLPTRLATSPASRLMGESWWP